MLLRVYYLIKCNAGIYLFSGIIWNYCCITQSLLSLLMLLSYLVTYTILLNVEMLEMCASGKWIVQTNIFLTVKVFSIIIKWDHVVLGLSTFSDVEFPFNAVIMYFTKTLKFPFNGCSVIHVRLSPLALGGVWTLRSDDVNRKLKMVLR